MTMPARFRLFRAALLLRPALRALVIALGFWRLTVLALAALPSPAQTIPFTVCKESTTWTRPTANEQAKIWNDPRYTAGAKAYEWNHDFLFVPTDSASIQYHMENEAGLWTEGTFSPTCNNDKRNDEWIEAWILLHRVKNIQVDGSVYTITVEPTRKGFSRFCLRGSLPR